MPYKLDLSLTPGLNNLGPSAVPGASITEITGFEALFVAGEGQMLDGDGQTVDQWAARDGTGAFTSSADGRRPVVGTQDGQSVLVFDGSKTMGLGGLTIGEATDYTIGIRFHQNDFTLSSAMIMGDEENADYSRLRARYSSGNYYYVTWDSALGGDPLVDLTPANGWHSALICQGGGTVKMAVDESAFDDKAEPNLYLPNFYIGSAAGNYGSANVSIRSLFFVRKDISGDVSELADAWVTLKEL